MKNDATITFRLPQTTKDRLEAAAATARMSLSEFIVSRCLRSITNEEECKKLADEE